MPLREEFSNNSGVGYCYCLIAPLHRWGGSPMGWWSCSEDIRCLELWDRRALWQGRHKVQALIATRLGARKSCLHTEMKCITWLGLVKLKCYWSWTECSWYCYMIDSLFGNGPHWLPKVEIPRIRHCLLLLLLYLLLVHFLLCTWTDCVWLVWFWTSLSFIAHPFHFVFLSRLWMAWSWHEHLLEIYEMFIFDENLNLC